MVGKIKIGDSTDLNVNGGQMGRIFIIVDLTPRVALISVSFDHEPRTAKEECKLPPPHLAVVDSTIFYISMYRQGAPEMNMERGTYAPQIQRILDCSHDVGNNIIFNRQRTLPYGNYIQ